MIDYSSLYTAMREAGLHDWAKQVPQQIAQGLDPKRYGDLPAWEAALAQLPSIDAHSVALDASAITVRTAEALDDALRQQVRAGLERLIPWRKGPFEVHGVYIDTEWRSDWKWDRLCDGISPLAGRKVLDVGCGNGYHCWRMAGAGAQFVLGIDPSPRFHLQFHAIRHFIGDHDGHRVHHLPIGIEGVPPQLEAFDTVFSMGVLYHRRSPIDHLLQLRDCLRPGGELVLETLIIEGDAQQVLVPEDRYAMMRNVWFIPSVAALELWLRRSRFDTIRVVDVSTTTTEEQRATEWMRFHSLPEFLDPDNPALTVEGLPAPKRAILVATKPR